MKSVIITAPGRASYRDVEVPRLEREQVLVHVASVGICMSDVELFDGIRPPEYVRYPVQPGHEWSGTIVEVGADVRHLRIGQRVAVEGQNFCGRCFWCRRDQTNLCETYNEFGFTLPGGYAEYVAARADLAHPFPDPLPFDVAALAEPAACALHGIARAGVQSGDTVVVIGPGTIGLLAAAWAHLASPQHLVVVAKDSGNERLARTVGATHYVTSGQQASSVIDELTGKRGADVVVDATGDPRAAALAAGLARRGGTVVIESISGTTAPGGLDPDICCLKDLRVHGVFAYTSRHFVEALGALERGDLAVAPLITHTFPLTDYAHAFELLKTRREPVVKIVLHPGG